MKNNVRIKVNPDGLKQLEQEIAASIRSQGIDATCPHCGNTVTVHETPAKCPVCDQEFQVALKF